MEGADETTELWRPPPGRELFRRRRWTTISDRHKSRPILGVSQKYVTFGHISLHMELFSRRRWGLISAQLSNKFGYCPWCTVSIVLYFHKHNSLPLGQIQAFISPKLPRSPAYHLVQSCASYLCTKIIHACGMKHLLCKLWQTWTQDYWTLIGLYHHIFGPDLP